MITIIVPLPICSGICWDISLNHWLRSFFSLSVSFSMMLLDRDSWVPSWEGRLPPWLCFLDPRSVVLCSSWVPSWEKPPSWLWSINPSLDWTKSVVHCITAYWMFSIFISWHSGRDVYSSTVFDLFPPLSFDFLPQYQWKGGKKPWIFEKFPPPTGGGNVEQYTALKQYVLAKITT